VVIKEDVGRWKKSKEKAEKGDMEEVEEEK
jgi:hypothetical protein